MGGVCRVASLQHTASPLLPFPPPMALKRDTECDIRVSESPTKKPRNEKAPEVPASSLTLTP
jgi:hypothetical protein